MPALERSVRVTDIYRQRLLRLHELAQRIGVWTVDGEDIDGTGRDWLDRVVAQLEVIQGAGASLSAGYAAAFLASERNQPTEPLPVDDSAVGTTQDGQPLLKALTASLITVKMAISDGRERQEALKLGQQRADRTISDAALHAPRQALQSAIQQETFVGWRRVTAGGCGACLAATTDVIEQAAKPLRVHSNCKCSIEPVVRDVSDTVKRPTGREMFDSLSFEQQAMLLGEEKAALIRSGQVPFERLLQHQPMAVAPDGITERPLQALVV